MDIQQIVNHNKLPEEQKQKKILGKDDFLTLMLKQIQYQDPLEPIDNSQLSSQLAQFSSLEQMSNLNTNILKGNKLTLFAQATHLIGKEITAVHLNELTQEEEVVQEAVKSVVMGADGPILTLESGVSIQLDQVREVQQMAQQDQLDTLYY